MDDKNSFEAGIYQFIIWCILLLFIVLRLISFSSPNNTWVWIMNYLGMLIAMLNLFINKAIELRSKNSIKYKPFKGLIILLVVVLCILILPIHHIQTTELCSCVNDTITLIALFFSLSPGIWSKILDGIIYILER